MEIKNEDLLERNAVYARKVRTWQMVSAALAAALAFTWVPIFVLLG